MDDHQFKEEELKSVGELSTICSQILLNLDAGRFVILWFVNKFACCFHKMNKILWHTLLHSSYKWLPATLCGKHNTTVHTWIVARLRWNSMHVRKSHVLFQSVECVRNRLQLHTVFREVEIISLGAGLRMDGTPALTLWVLVIEVFHSVPNKNDGHKREPRGNPSVVVKSNMHKTHPNQVHQRHSNKRWSHSTKYNAFWSHCYVVVWGQRGSN